MSKRGKYIVLEGGDGCGKSTQIGMLSQELIKRGYSILNIREPGSTPLAEKIRAILSDPLMDKYLVPSTEILLYTAIRDDLCRRVIGPALKKGTNVLTDRNFLSSVIYQGYAGGEDVNFIKEINHKTLSRYDIPFVPDIGVIIDLPLNKNDLIQAVIRDESKKDDRFHQKEIDYHRKVYESYLKIAEEFGFKVIPYQKGHPERMHKQILEYVLSKL